MVTALRKRVGARYIPVPQAVAPTPHYRTLRNIILTVTDLYKLLLDAPPQSVPHVDALWAPLLQSSGIVSLFRSVNRARGLLAGDIGLLVNGLVDFLGVPGLVDSFGRALTKRANSAFDAMAEDQADADAGADSREPVGHSTDVDADNAVGGRGRG